MIEVLDLFDTRYFDFTARHFWDKLVSEHDFKRSYNWVRLTLQAHGRTSSPTSVAIPRTRRPTRPRPGRMCAADESSCPAVQQDLQTAKSDCNVRRGHGPCVGKLSRFFMLALTRFPRRADRAVARQKSRPSWPFRTGWPPVPAAWMRSTRRITLTQPGWPGIVFPAAAFPFGDLL